MLYKLDLGIDHVLIDEAQDTSPKQWEIVRTDRRRVLRRRRAARNVRRTIFAVGDEKQSIFSFQGAAPRAFDEMRARIRRPVRYARARLALVCASIIRSARAETCWPRSTRFSRAQEIFDSVTADAAGIPPHERAARCRARAGRDLWPLIAPDKSAADKEAWDAPSIPSARGKPARAAARNASPRTSKLMDGARPKAGDVLVLVRQRGPLFEAIIRALKAAEIPVAGADRLVLTEHIAVMDLMALADALLLPDDDLALASVLKSPLFGLTKKLCSRSAWDRKGSLRGARAVARPTRISQTPNARLDGISECCAQANAVCILRACAGRVARPRANFSPGSVRRPTTRSTNFSTSRSITRRARRPRCKASSPGCAPRRSEVKRDMEMARDEVRVMTVHGAKGLEANIVILADTTTSPTGPKDPRLLPLAQGELVWATAQAQDTAAMTDARSKAPSKRRATSIAGFCTSR